MSIGSACRVSASSAALALSLAALAACASGGSRIARGGDPNVLERAEIERAETMGARNAFEVVERLRPQWLLVRGERSINLETMIAVYQNNLPLGGPSTLRDIPLEVIESMRVLDSALAGQLPGLGSRHVERAIVVRLRSRQ